MTKDDIITPIAGELKPNNPFLQVSHTRTKCTAKRVLMSITLSHENVIMTNTRLPLSARI
jgi:hypothetical protein